MLGEGGWPGELRRTTVRPLVTPSRCQDRGGNFPDPQHRSNVQQPQQPVECMRRPMQKTVTVEANALIAPLNDRMPAILRREDYARWLGSEEDPRDVLRLYPAELMMHGRRR
jgi:SOS response associated peptidase (SRAP)